MGLPVERIRQAKWRELTREPRDLCPRAETWVLNRAPETAVGWPGFLQGGPCPAPIPRSDVREADVRFL